MQIRSPVQSFNSVQNHWIRKIPQQKAYDDRIQKTLELLRKSGNISNRKLAEQAGMSINSFLNLFLDEVGMPPQSWSRIKRLEQAGELLHFSEATMDDIAASSGFCDRYHLSRAFKQQFGISPAQYRQQARKLRDSWLVNYENSDQM